MAEVWGCQGARDCGSMCNATFPGSAALLSQSLNVFRTPAGVESIPKLDEGEKRKGLALSQTPSSVRAAVYRPLAIQSPAVHLFTLLCERKRVNKERMAARLGTSVDSPGGKAKLDATGLPKRTVSVKKSGPKSKPNFLKLG